MTTIPENKTPLISLGGSRVLLALSAVCGLASIGALSIFVSSSRQPGEDRPKLAVDRFEHDFAKVGQAQELTTKFTVTNKFNHPIEIRDVRGNCGCTDLSVDQKKLKPGGTAKVSTTLHTGKARGKLRKQVYVTYAIQSGFVSPQQKEEVETLVLKLNADVEPDFLIEPRGLDFRMGESRSASISLTPVLQQDLVILGVSVSHQSFHAEVSSAGETELSVLVRFNADKWVGTAPGNATLTIQTNSQVSQICHVPLRILPPVVYPPEGIAVQAHTTPTPK